MSPGITLANNFFLKSSTCLSVVMSACAASTSAIVCAAQRTTIPPDVKVFDRPSKRLQRDRSSSHPDFEHFRYVKDEFGERLADRVFDLTGFNEICLDLGCSAGHVAPHLIKENVGMLMQCDMSRRMVERSRGAPQDEFPVFRIHADEELVPFRDASVDLILSNLSAHWVNDLPGWFSKCLKVLRPDGCLIGSIFSGETLYQLRVSLQLAEMERLGGLGAHISPFVEAIDIGALMSRAGFAMITLDLDELEVGYPDIFTLMYDLQGMAESNASLKRTANLRRDVLIAADAIYRRLYAVDGKYPATFQVVSFIGWRPGPKMPKPAKRGSQNVSFKDIPNIIETQGEYVSKR